MDWPFVAAALALDCPHHRLCCVIQTVALAEVIARNALDRQLAAWAANQPGNRSWPDIVPLDARGQVDIVEARRRVE